MMSNPTQELRNSIEEFYQKYPDLRRQDFSLAHLVRYTLPHSHEDIETYLERLRRKIQ